MLRRLVRAPNLATRLVTIFVHVEFAYLVIQLLVKLHTVPVTQYSRYLLISCFEIISTERTYHLRLNITSILPLYSPLSDFALYNVTLFAEYAIIISLLYSYIYIYIYIHYYVQYIVSCCLATFQFTGVYFPSTKLEINIY